MKINTLVWGSLKINLDKLLQRSFVKFLHEIRGGDVLVFVLKCYVAITYIHEKIIFNESIIRFLTKLSSYWTRSQRSFTTWFFCRRLNGNHMTLIATRSPKYLHSSKTHSRNASRNSLTETKKSMHKPWMRMCCRRPIEIIQIFTNVLSKREMTMKCNHKKILEKRSRERENKNKFKWWHHRELCAVS